MLDDESANKNIKVSNLEHSSDNIFDGKRRGEKMNSPHDLIILNMIYFEKKFFFWGKKRDERNGGIDFYQVRKKKNCSKKNLKKIAKIAFFNLSTFSSSAGANPIKDILSFKSQIGTIEL